MARLLHVMNGHSMCPLFEQSDLPGVMTVYADALHDGPVPAGLSDDELRDVRARFIAGPDGAWQRVAADLRAWDDALAAFDRYDEIVLWFEHDLFDQLLLIRHLAWFATRLPAATRLSLICVDSYPGVERFRGLGELKPHQLAALFATRAAVTTLQMDLGVRAWRAFTAPDPRPLERLFAGDLTALLFLGPALHRHAQEFPAPGTGLPRTEREVLSLLAGGVSSPAALFRDAGRGETCFFIGDTQFRWRLDALASAPRPLSVMALDAEDAALLPRGTVSITAAGRDVLAGRADWVSMTPFDRWLGGVHLQRGAIWRWDEPAHAFAAD